MIALLILSAGMPPDWHEVISEECGFRISLPGKGILSEGPYDVGRRVLEIPGGFQAEVVTYASVEDRNSFNVSCAVYTELYFNFVDRDDFLDGGVQRFAGTGGTLVRQSEIEIDGHPGRSFTIELTPGRAYSYNRMVLVNNKFIQLGVGHLGEDVEDSVDETIDMFFASLELQ